MKWWTESGPVRKPPAPAPQAIPMAPAKLSLVTNDFSAYTPPALRERVPHAPAAAVADSSDVTAAKARGRVWWRWVRDAAIGVTLLVAAPVAVIGVGFRPLMFMAASAETRLRDLEPLREWRAPQTASVDPLLAGEALARLSDLSHRKSVPLRFAAEAKAQLASIEPPDSALFPTVRKSTGSVILDYSQLIVAAARGVTANEANWLQRTATLPLWRDADLVASASRVDVLGGRFVQPMSAELSLWRLPIPNNNKVRDLANAGVARAAWYVTKGDYDAAEASLRTVVSFGFALVDNGVSLSDAFVGRSAIRIGTDGLAQLATVRGESARQQRIRAQLTIVERPRGNNQPILTIDDRDVLASLTDVRLPQTVRMERRAFMAYLPCTSVRGVLFGITSNDRVALEAADRLLTRFPADRSALSAADAAFYELPEHLSGDGPANLLLGVARVASTVTGNKRIAACMAPIAGGL